MAREGRGTLPDSLHQIHAAASRSEGLTTFDELTTPPRSSSISEAKGIEIVQGGLSSLYSRLRASVGGSKDGTAEVSEDSSSPHKLVTNGHGQPSQGSPATAVSSPVVVSATSSRLQSPHAPQFPELQLPLPSRDSNVSLSAVSGKASFNGSKTSLVTNRSRPSIAASMETHEEAATEAASDVSSHSRKQSGAVVDSPLPGSPQAHFPSARSRGGPFRQRQGDMDMGDESDTTEDDMVMVDGGGFATSNSKPAMPPGQDETPQVAAKSESRGETHLQPGPSFVKSTRDSLGKGAQVADVSRITASAQTPVIAPAPQRPPMMHVGPSHLPGFLNSRTSSSDGLSSVLTSTTVRSPTVPPIDELKQQTAGNAPANVLPDSYLSQMRRKILDREFWMRDENAKDCFNCGDSFSTFRRKHHCRTCGQIFDAKCTSLVSGRMFGQSGNLRVCKPCEAIIYGHEDDSSVYTDDGDQGSTYEQEDTGDLDPSESDHTKIGTPTISIPMSRKAGSEKKRRSAVIEVAPPALARPSSSRSLRSLSGRPRSSSHKRHKPQHQHMRNVKYDERAPFHQQDVGGTRSRSALPAFHHDNIIDPDLAPFMSDEDSTEDENPSIFATLRGDSPSQVNVDNEKGGLGGLLLAMRKAKAKSGDRSSAHGRDIDNVSVTSRHVNRHSRRRNLSVTSLTHARPSPRRSKSNTLLRTFGATLGVSGALEHASTSSSPHPSNVMPRPALGITRSASMRGANTPSLELNQASMHHVRMLLKQMLSDAVIPHAASWEKALLPILLQCTDDVNPDVQRNDDMDIRHYIKLKKIPGGRPKDTSYVSGVVFTKQLERKDMPRSIPNPRIIIVTFAIEYARHQAHFIQLDRVVAQEREYLRNLVGRIAHLKPNLLLVQRNVSGLALEFLQEAGIVVASNVKETVLNAVSRCTGAPMISSVDKLAIDRAFLGQCDSFNVKTYVHNNLRKTYIYLSGCQPDLGCTIVLRGADTQVLRRLKRITEFMCFVVYNLKLETCLMRDEFVMIPSSSIGGTLDPEEQLNHQETVDQAKEGDKDPENNTRVHEATEKTGPEHNSGSQPSTVELLLSDKGGPAPSFYSEMVEKHRTTILSASPFVKFAQPYLLNQAREYERRLGYLRRLRDQYTNDETDEKDESPEKFELVRPEMVHTMVNRASKQVREFLHAVHASEYDKAFHNYQTQKRHWEAFLSGNMDLYNPFNHQKIAALYSVVNSSTSTPCIGPEIIAFGFYHEHEYDDGFTPDCTLGQYVEDLIHTARMVCEVGNCNRRLLDHHRQYVHGQGQMSVHVVPHPPKLKTMQNTILMWSACRKCGIESQVMPMSHNTWKYSFAKYLELTFWSTDLHPRSNVCPHDIHREHIRFFGLNNLALRIQYDQVPLYEVIVPRPVITWKVDGDLKLKNELYLNILERLEHFTASVRARLNSIRAESVMPEKVDLCRAEVEKLMKRANDEHEWLKRKLQDKYMTSKYYEIIPLNRAIRAIQEKAIAWDDTFTQFEEEFFPSEKDIKRLAALQLKRIFLERDESTSSLTSVEEGAESVEEEPALNDRGEPIPTTPMPSTMSPERARHMLSSVVEEDQSQSTRTEDSGSGTCTEPKSSTSPDASQILPLATPIDAVEREDVRHLDLAVSSNYAEHATSKEEHALKTPPSGSNSVSSLPPGSPTPRALPKVEPVDKSVADAIDNMPVSPTPVQITSSTLESKIPRLVDTIRREGTTRPAGVIRTQSQPGGVPRLQTRHLNTSSDVSGSGSSASGDSLKLTLSDSARALERRMSERLALGAFKQVKSSSMIPIPRSVPGRQDKATRVSALAKHFEQLQREFEKERRRERLQQQRANRHARAYPLASSKPIVEVYNDVHEAVQEHNPSDEDVQPSPARISTDNSTLEDSAYTHTTTGATTVDTSPVEERHHNDAESECADREYHAATPSHPASDVENEASDVELGPEDIPLPDSIGSSQLLENSLELPKHEKTTLMKMLTSFWSERSASGWTALEYPLGHNEHVWEDSDIIVREDEPSSIIALALSSPDYLTKLQTFRDDPAVAPNGVGGLEGPEVSIERNLLHEANTNIRYSFSNRGVKAQCKIFYAQSFDALRRKTGVADRFVESLSRCSKWDSKGGKSKSIFLKTLDERFVLKSLSTIEVNAFFRFAPNYFAFTHQNLFKGLPSVIAKMFGLFQVQIKTPSGRDFDGFMLVMENLFYEREPNRRYDLKGSMRNRKVQSTGDRDEVLLDENLVDIIYSETPIFVREHTKKLLKASVWNDTLFLQQQNVMDYSLMAGFHDESREIIVGIIDCIRTYTWDKKLESWIKDRGKNKPTITSPKDYRNRFRMAMEKYILQAPNCWHQFSGRMVGVGVPKRMPLLQGVEGIVDGKRRVEKGRGVEDEEKAS